MRKQHTNPPGNSPSFDSEIDEGERRFRSLADAIPQLVWTASPDGTFEYCNQRWITYTGLTLEQSQRGDWRSLLIHPDDLQHWIDHRARGLERGEAFEGELRFKRASDDVYRWQLARGVPIKDANGHIVKWVGTSTDIEDQKQAQAAAESANRAKSDFLSGMSHELRSPLNAILGFAQLMASDSPPPTPSQQASIDQILRAGWHLLELINEVLDLAKIESGQVSLSQESVSLAEVMRECQEMIEPQAQQRGMRMSFPRFDLPCFVHGDRTRVKQILINLLSNAIKYNREQGSVEVTCSANTAERMRVNVRDGGPGLPPDKLAQLFQPFNRLGQEAGAEEGTGIGLVVAKRLVELMGGAIGAESTVGAGSVFWFELRSAAAPRVAAGGPEPAVLAKAQVQDGASPHTLLYVEDNPANLELVEQLIARHTEMRLLTAVNGKLGIALARTAQPEVIVMDINLPDISGTDALKILRDDPATAHIPVIALSANAMPRDIAKGMKAGFFRYVTKPIKLDEFMDALNLALEFAQVNQRQ
ncbi:hybrid sensor histidine kinase/response regulator [Undibacterium arcticum]|uniref:histidine kinase n=1 Tax=Undibacterium arcticum TaxID=1762892 RepID=A0ABV7EXT6_9BURK